MRNPSSSSSRSSTTTTPCCAKVGIKRGPWTPEEDEILANYVKKEGEGRWRTLPKRAGLLRCGKSCRLRWMNYLRPSVKRGKIAPDEEDLILRLHRLLGNRWSLIAGRIPGRTDNEIKNYWNTHLSKKLISQGIDPRTHKPLILNPSPNYEIEVNDVASTSNPNKPYSNSSEFEETGIESQSIFATDQQMNTNIKVPVSSSSVAHRYGGFGQIGAGNGNFHQGWQNNHGVNEGVMTMEGLQNNNYAHNNQGFNGQYYTENNNEDMLSSFLDSLINDDVYPNQQRPNLLSTPASFPLFSPTVNFGHGVTMWENEIRSTRDNLADHRQRQGNYFA